MFAQASRASWRRDIMPVLVGGAPEVERARALHQRLVEVEEGGGLPRRRRRAAG